MKNILFSSLLTATIVLIGQSYPVLFGLLVYFGFAYLFATKIMVPIILEQNRRIFGSDSYKFMPIDYFFEIVSSVVWPVSFIMISIIEYDTLKKLYNLPSIRNPFFWEEK